MVNKQKNSPLNMSEDHEMAIDRDKIYDLKQDIHKHDVKKKEGPHAEGDITGLPAQKSGSFMSKHSTTQKLNQNTGVMDRETKYMPIDDNRMGNVTKK